MKLYQFQFSSLFPIIFEGDFIAYNSDGTARRKTTFKSGEALDNTIYWPNGNIHYQYFDISNKTETELKDIISQLNGSVGNLPQYEYHKVIYTAVNDMNGESVLDNRGDGKEKISDIVSYEEREIIREFQGNRLIRSYINKDGRKIYQLTNTDYYLNLNRFQNLMAEMMDLSSTNTAHQNNVQGVVLVSFEINEKGRIQQFKLLNRLYPAINRKINQLAQNMINMRIRKLKINKKAVTAEIVVPFVFKMGLFHSIPVSPFNHLQMMQMHQMNNPYLNTPPNINPPNIRW
ncbi:MAG: hypothetical protein ACOCVN_00245 [bacterium]